MPIENKIGYDIIYTYTEEELTRLYIKEGMDSGLAKKKAKEIALEINRMAQEERRLWVKVRENEKLAGIEPEPPIETLIGY